MWIIAVGALALAVGVAIVSVLGVADALLTDIASVLGHRDLSASSNEFLILCSPPSDVGRGMALGLLALLFGGPPAAIVGTALAARQRTGRRERSEDWGAVLSGGFVFQLGSSMSTAFVLLLALAVAAEDVFVFGGRIVVDAAAFAGTLVLALAWSLWGLRSWCELQWTIPQAPTTILPRGR
jgi:hypothetical protein